MPKNKEKPWIMVRLKRTTHARLTALGRMWWEKLDCAVKAHYSPEAQAYTLDAIVAELLARDEAHRARSRKSIARTRDTAGPATADGG